MRALIEQMVNIYGATGREMPVATVIENLLKDHADSITTDAMGNLFVEKKVAMKMENASCLQHIWIILDSLL